VKQGQNLILPVTEFFWWSILLLSVQLYWKSCTVILHVDAKQILLFAFLLWFEHLGFTVLCYH